MVELTSENLTCVGGPMGTERTWTNWRKFFNTIEDAKAYAEKDYNKEIQWDKSKGPTRDFVPLDLTCSGDLGYVMYHIRDVKVER